MIQFQPPQDEQEAFCRKPQNEGPPADEVPPLAGSQSKRNLAEEVNPGQPKAFTKEELAIKNIRDDAAALSEDKTGQNSYQRHVAQLKADKARRQESQLTSAGKTKHEYVPCLYLPYVGGSSKLLIYFHGNAEDVGLAMELLTFIKDMLRVSWPS